MAISREHLPQDNNIVIPQRMTNSPRPSGVAGGVSSSRPSGTADYGTGSVDEMEYGRTVKIIVAKRK
jgi:hypothetical protein